MILSAAITLAIAQTSARPATPLEPIGAIVDAFRDRRVVVVGEWHNSELQHELLRAMIRDPRFTATVNDVVVEFGNALYQDVVDRFVRGEDVPLATLRQSWLQTTAGINSWNNPIYEAFYREVRAVNQTLPPARRLRLLMGDPAIDWNAADLGGWTRRPNGSVQWPRRDEEHDRDFHAVNVIRSEVLAKNRKALVLYGNHHVERQAVGVSVVGILENRFATKTFAVATVTSLPSDYLGRITAPKLFLLRGTTLGRLDLTYVVTAARPEISTEANFDAILWLGR